MKIYYNDKDGKIFYIMKDIDDYYFSHKTNIPLTVLSIDETAPNKTLILDIFKNRGRIDANGEGKYSVVGGVATAKLGWEQFVDPTPLNTP